MAEDAAIDDRRLDLYSLETERWWQILPLLPAIWRGTHTTRPGVRALSGTEFEVYTQKPRAVNTDGEITARTPAHFRVIPQALAVLAPAK